MKIALIITGVLIGIFIIYFVINILIYKKRMKNYSPEDESERLINLNDSNFSQTIKDGVSLVDFWAAWCQPCRIIAPTINSLAEEIGDKVQICKLDIDKNKNAAQKLRVRSIPTLIIFKDGKEVQRIVGIKPKSFLKKSIEKYL